jgi:predicted metalloendopeptidase
MSDEIEKESLADWKTYLRWHAAHDAATSLSAAFVKENFSFYGKTLRGREELPPRWKRCANDVDNDLGESARPGVRGQVLQSAGQAGSVDHCERSRSRDAA